MKYFIIIIFLLSALISRTYVYPHTDILSNIRSCAERPELEYSILSPSSHFKIHYDNYYDGIDAFAYDVGVAADSSRSVIVDIMEFRSEIADSDDIYDIYIKELPNGQYGWNCLDSDASGSSWIKIDDNYIGNEYPIATGVDAMKITVAHEYFHAVQRAYLPSSSDNVFFFELSSIWIEDIIYPDINDYIVFGEGADYYFDDPGKNIDEYYGYGLGLYGHYLNSKFNNQIMQRIWKSLSTINTNNNDYIITSINSVLSNEDYQYNSSFTQTWVDFNARNLFNNKFSTMNNEIYYYEDQIYFNPISSSPINIQEENSVDFDINNTSVSIKSFNINSVLFFNILNNPDYSDTYGLIAVVSDCDSYIEPIYNTYQSQILDADDRAHILYMSEVQEREFESTISSYVLQNSNEITVFPHPIFHGNQFKVGINPGIQINNLSIDLYNAYGHFIKKINIGEVNYTLEDLNVFTLSPLDDFLSSGIYILSFNIDGRIQSKKIVYLK